MLTTTSHCYFVIGVTAIIISIIIISIVIIDIIIAISIGCESITVHALIFRVVKQASKQTEKSERCIDYSHTPISPCHNSPLRQSNPRVGKPVFLRQRKTEPSWQASKPALWTETEMEGWVWRMGAAGWGENG